MRIWQGCKKETSGLGWFILGFAFIMAVMLCASCVSIFPKAPYPYSYHQENKTCDYYLYHQHYEGERRQK